MSCAGACLARLHALPPLVGLFDSVPCLPACLPGFLSSMTTDQIISRTRMIQTEINVHKQAISQLSYKIKDKQEKIKDNKEKIKLNKQLPYLCAHVVEVRD